jgi:hypothetical protein
MATVLTNVGEDWACQRLAGSGAMSASSGQYIGWGTGAGTAAKGDTTLFTESAETRATGTVSVTGSGATAKYQVVGTITATGSRAITNAGNFDASTSGNLFVKGDFATINLSTDDSIQFTITIDPS